LHVKGEYDMNINYGTLNSMTDIIKLAEENKISECMGKMNGLVLDIEKGINKIDHTETKNRMKILKNGLVDLEEDIMAQKDYSNVDELTDSLSLIHYELVKPVVTIKLSEHERFQKGEKYSLLDIDRLFNEIDTRVDKEIEKPGHIEPSYYKVKFLIESYIGTEKFTYGYRQDLSNGEGGIIGNIENSINANKESLMFLNEYTKEKEEMFQFLENSYIPSLKSSLKLERAICDSKEITNENKILKKEIKKKTKKIETRGV
jgi:hypothetical protein